MAAFKLNRYEVDPKQIMHYNQDLQLTTLSAMIRRSAHRYADRPLFGEKRAGQYQWMTYAAFYERVLKMRSLLRKLGLGHGDRLAMIANNSIIYAEAIYAAYGLGAVVVPMYEVQTLEDWRFIFGDAQPKIAIVRNEGIREKIESLQSAGLEQILVIDAQNGQTLAERVDAETPIDDAWDDAHEDELCDIIYTSGTTSRPHGVELTHKNVMHNVMICAQMFDYGCEDRILSFLPWAHGFGKTVDLTLFPALGAAVGLAESAKTIAVNLTEVNPTVLCAVPKIFNRIYDVVNLKLENNAVLRHMFERAQAIMHKARKHPLSLTERIEYKVMDRLVASKVRGAFGNSLKFCVSGGASLSREVATFFEDFGVRVFEGYGMTEHSPVISINYDPDKIGSVGVPLPGVKVEIEPLEGFDDDDRKIGEIVISSDCVMRGYHNDDASTAAAIDERGRLHTGDTGYIDAQGFIHIKGRIKEQYKLQNGKYVVPAALENVLNTAPEIEFSVVFGAGQPCNVALLHPSESCLNKFMAAHPNLKNAPKSVIEEHPDLRAAMAQAMARVDNNFRGYERPQRFAITLETFSIQNGLLTPALKIKRRAVEKFFANKLEALYRVE